MNEQDLTIEDFGKQWTRYSTFSGYLASQELLADNIQPLLSVAELSGARVAEIGAGQGRFSTMLLTAGVAEVVAIEPSAAFDVLRRHLEPFGSRATCLNARGDAIPAGSNFDYVFSIGVLHHIDDPLPTVKAARQSLRAGGRMLVWLYGHEGNESYLRFAIPLRRITSRLPSPVLAAVSHLLAGALTMYIWLCRPFALPMRQYMRNVLAPMTWRQRMLTVFDQLNPTTAKYYKEGEARALLEDAGFADVRLHHRHGYSWTVIGTRE
jgi:SAM-dependent methyltransferase